MKIITACKVHLLAVPTFFPHKKYELPPHDSSAENLIAHAGKGCYDSYGRDGRSVPEHIASLIGSGHGSVLEHAHVSLFIEGISRGCSHEIVRHRLFNYSQRSTRYTAEEDAAIVLEPYLADLYNRREALEHSFEAQELSTAENLLLDDFLEAAETAMSAYATQVIDLEQLNPDKLKGRDLRKWARGKARQLLPHALETRMTMTGNLRSWRDFVEARSSRHAEPEIRRLAEEVFVTIKHVAPNVFFDAAVEMVAGWPEITFKVRKV